MLDEDYPEYPSHERVLGYFRDFVRTFGLAPHIELGKVVTKVAPRGDRLWEVTVAGEAEPRIYRGVVMASGHHDTPRMPAYPGTFAGEILHSRALQEPQAGARQARAGGGLRQLGGRHRRRTPCTAARRCS